MDIRVGNKKLEHVEEFTYLRAVLTKELAKTDHVKKDIRYRIRKASSVFAKSQY